MEHAWRPVQHKYSSVRNAMCMHWQENNGHHNAFIIVSVLNIVPECHLVEFCATDMTVRIVAS